MAILTYGAIAVPILHEFVPEQIHNIVNHSDAKLLFAGDVVATQIDPTKMPRLEEAKLIGFTQTDLINIMEQNRAELNKQLPAFCKISKIHLQEEEFKKTPKKSIKRYLYQ